MINVNFDVSGVAANVKLLLKLIQDHKDGCEKEKNDSRRMLRVATMMTILDNVRERIQKCQSFGNKRSQAELRRCNTDVRRNQIPRDKRAEPVVEDEKERLRRELAASVAARKSLQIMCSSLGKEKEIMGTELLKKVHEVSEMEELISALNAQNKTLLQKVQECASQHKGKKYSGAGAAASGGGEAQVINALQERNKVLSEQLLKSIDGYRSMKRKLKAAQEENVMMHSIMNEMGGKAVVSLERVKSLKERISSSSSSESESPVDVKEEIGALESMFEGFQMLVGKHDAKQGDCAQREGQINACKPPSLLA